MIIKKLFLLFYCSYLINSCSSSNYESNVPYFINTINKSLTYEYNENAYLDLKEIYYSLTKNDYNLIKKKIRNKTDINSVVNIIIFLSLNNDKKIYEEFLKIYKTDNDNTINAGLEIYFYKVLNENKYLDGYKIRLNNLTNYDSNILWYLISLEKNTAFPIIFKLIKKKYPDGSGAELIFGMLSWIDKDKKWLQENRWNLLKLELNKYK